MIKHEITSDNYFDDKFQKDYMSVSQFKSFLECEAKTIAVINGEFDPFKSDAFLEGHYVEEALTGDLTKFVDEHNKEIISSTGATKGQPKAKFKLLDSVTDFIKEDKFFMEYLNGEKQVVKTGLINSVPFKIMMDINHPERIVDLKAMAPFRGSRVSFISKYGYDIQGAVYQAIEGNKKPFYLAVLTKEEYPDKMIIQIDQEYLDYAYNIVVKNAPRFQAIKDGVLTPERCEICDYCKMTKKLTTTLKLKEMIMKENELYE